ncbi:hypothetical protein NOC27_1189 [Nitrosococcus oceani AFC27]|nr:hypothetical protein NOC27_1189 [Nitrosococcus oceani AFC27]
MQAQYEAAYAINKKIFKQWVVRKIRFCNRLFCLAAAFILTL